MEVRVTPLNGGAINSSGGSGGMTGNVPAENSGCSCTMASRSSSHPGPYLLLLLMLGARRRIARVKERIARRAAA